MAAGPHTLNFSSNISYEITEEGYLLQREGVNPETGKAWEPTWVSKSICPPEIVELWEVMKVGKQFDGFEDCFLTVLLTARWSS